VRKALLLARREIVEQYTDRGAIMRALFLTALPIVLVLTSRGAAGARGGDVVLLIYCLQAAFLPAMTAINMAAASFAAEKEAQTLVPLLAAPIRDIDIVAGKLIAILIPASFFSALSIGAFYVAATATFGADRVARVLQPATLLAFLALSVFFILTTGAWVMVISARVASQRAAQQIAGFFVAAMIVALVAGAGGGLIGSDLRAEVLVGIVVAVLVSDLVALELARRLWDREEAVARL
jgi:hypothetical protein